MDIIYTFFRYPKRTRVLGKKSCGFKENDPSGVGAGNPPLPTVRGGAGKGSRSVGRGGAGQGTYCVNTLIEIKCCNKGDLDFCCIK